jgi:hypothetical protein
MARSESQGLQIAVILLTMCVVGLAISTWVYYQAADTNLKLKESADNTAKDAKKQGEKLAFANKVLSYVNGDSTATKDEIAQLKTSTGGDPTAEAALAKYEKLMAGHPEKAVSGEAKGLSALPDYILTTTGERNKQLTESVGRENVLTVEKAAIDTRETGRTATAEQGMKKAVDDLNAERDAFNKERDDFKKSLDDLRNTIAQRDAQLKELTEKSNKELGARDLRIIALEKDQENLREKLLATTKDGPSFEAPDGEITWVNQRQRAVWINVGHADGLTRQTTFSVYDHDENGVSSAKRKARIEVISITQPHLAECRILEDEIKNPILPGDKIFTPAWSPGQHLHFAINGSLFIDADKNPDNEEVRSIIELNGGEVDAEVKPDGTIMGKINSQTRYLIRGKVPSEKEYAGEGKGAVDNWSAMTEQAKDNGVEIIDISRFLNMMGWKAQDRTTALGGRKTATKRSSSADKRAAGTAEKAEKTDEEPADEKPAAKPAKAGAEDEDPFGK